MHSISPKQLEILPQAVLGVGVDGNIEFVFKSKQLFEQAQVNVSDFETIQLKRSQFLIPGFVDTHTHAPQHINSGLGLDEELLKWLNVRRNFCCFLLEFFCLSFCRFFYCLLFSFLAFCYSLFRFT